MTNNSSRELLTALHVDDIPLAKEHLERGFKVRLELPRFLRYENTLGKLARAKPDLLRTSIECADLETQERFDAMLARFSRRYEIADDGELPPLLRKGAWPIQQPARKPLVLRKERVAEIAGNLDWFSGFVRWPEGVREATLREMEEGKALRKPSARKKKAGDVPDESLAALASGDGDLEFMSLIDHWAAADEAEFIRIWNDRSTMLCQRFVVARWTWLPRPTVARMLLARFGVAVLPGVLKVSDKSPLFADPLLYVESPACAPLVAAWMASGSAARGARKCALSYPETCVRGLIPDAVSKVGKERTAAESVLRFLASRGHREMIMKLAAQFGDDVRESVTESLLRDFRCDFGPAKPVRFPHFWSADVYPAPLLKASGKAVPSHAIDALASMMSMSSVEVRCPALDEVLDALEPKSLAAFAWGAFEDWAEKGKKDSEWIFDALAYLGDDDCARKLTPHIRDWPRRSGTARAIRGLEILAAIGSDVALRQIQAIAQKNKYQPVLQSAQAMMQVIAAARELTPSQLEDRLVPDLGLSDKGELTLNFGSRQFIGSVDAKLAPLVRDASGAKLKALPSAGQEDDKALAKAAAATWSEFCSELKPIAKLQLARLELAMIHSRRWSGTEFRALFVSNPLLQAPVKALVWGVFGSKSKTLVTFVVSADGAFVDAEGKVLDLSDDASVGIVHPVLMSEASLSAWTRVFSEQRKLQPFTQLTRKVYRAKEDVGHDHFGLNGATVASRSLKGLLAAGWRTEVGDGGAIWSFFRDFPSGHATLIADPGMGITDYESVAKEQKIDVTIPKRLDPIEFSEVVRELMALRK